jgi:hypothetical protein
MSGFYGHWSVFEYEDGTHEVAAGVKEIAAYRDQARMIPINSHSGLAGTCAKAIKREIKGGWQPWDGAVIPQINNGTTEANIAPYRDVVAAIFDAAFPTPGILAEEFIRPHWGKHEDEEEWSMGMILMMDQNIIPVEVREAYQRLGEADQRWREANQRWREAYQRCQEADQRWREADMESHIKIFLAHPNPYWAERRMASDQEKVVV